MNIDSDYVQQMSVQLATYEVQGAISRLERNEANYKKQQDALGKLRSALSSFRSAANGLKSGNSRMLVNSASFSQEGYASATVGANAAAGRYQFHVEQLASAHQIALTEQALQGVVADEGEQTLKISLGDSAEGAFEIPYTEDLLEDGVLSLQKLAKAINESDENTGVKAAVLRQGDASYLLLSSEETGEENRISLSWDTTVLDEEYFSNKGFEEPQFRELSRALDAVVRLGGDSGIELKSSSNRFDNIIDGVSLTFNKTHAEGDAPLTIDIGRDDSATKEKAQKFVDAFNTLVSSFDSLTASGDESGDRGPLASDASARSIKSQLNNLLRRSFDLELEDGKVGQDNLASMGIIADRNGKLTIDSARFEAALADDPQRLDRIFIGKGNLLDSIDKTLSNYTNSANGLLTNRIDSLNQNMRRLDQQFESIQRQYDNYYNRYLRQFTTMMQTMQAMEQTHGMFG